jgi:hypothetical protein
MDFKELKKQLDNIGFVYEVSFNGHGRVLKVARDKDGYCHHFQIPIYDVVNSGDTGVDEYRLVFSDIMHAFNAQNSLVSPSLEHSDATQGISVPPDHILKIRYQRLLGLVQDVLYEAQNNPQRLVAFNSPLLGLLLLESYLDRNPEQEHTAEFQRQRHEFEAVLQHNRKKDMGV